MLASRIKREKFKHLIMKIEGFPCDINNLFDSNNNLSVKYRANYFFLTYSEIINDNSLKNNLENFKLAFSILLVDSNCCAKLLRVYSAIEINCFF